jgi:hypothetical protein
LKHVVIVGFSVIVFRSTEMLTDSYAGTSCVGPGVSEQVFAEGRDGVGGGVKTGRGVSVTVTGTFWGAGSVHPATRIQRMRASGRSNRKALFIAKISAAPD